MPYMYVGSSHLPLKCFDGSWVRIGCGVQYSKTQYCIDNTAQEMKVNWETDTNAKSQKSKNLLTKAEWAEQV